MCVCVNMHVFIYTCTCNTCTGTCNACTRVCVCVRVYGWCHFISLFSVHILACN